MPFLLSLLLVTLFFAGCDDGDIRGSTEPSANGKTYLVVTDDNGGSCDLQVDGKDWPHAIGEPGLIAPGEHTIECYGELSFTVPDGMVYSFDYWGP
jgi:hypothetical protein